MTCIVNYHTKKSFKEAVERYAGFVTIEDPSVFNPFSGTLRQYLEVNNACYVTNHPKRSWYARVILHKDGFRVT